MSLTDAVHPEDLRTRFRWVRHTELVSGAHVELDPGDDEEHCVVVRAGTVRTFRGDASLDLDACTVSRHLPGAPYRLIGWSDEPASVLVAAVATRPDGPTPDEQTAGLVARLDRSELSPFHAHGGIGHIGFRTLFDRRASSWHSVDHVLLPPRTSIGLHRNHDVEEVFAVLRGSGRMRVEDDRIDVAEGDCVPNPPGGVHGIANPEAAPLELLNFAVSSSGGPGVVTDLGDELRDLIGESPPGGR